MDDERRVRIDNLWNTHVGSSKIPVRQEVQILKRLKKNRVLDYKDIHLLYLRTKMWRAIRMRVLDRDGFACTKCGASNVELHVNHKKYGEMGKENLDDLETLCYRCHADVTKKFDLLGNRTNVGQESVNIADGKLHLALRRKG